MEALRNGDNGHDNFTERAKIVGEEFVRSLGYAGGRYVGVERSAGDATVLLTVALVGTETGMPRTNNNVDLREFIEEFTTKHADALKHLPRNARIVLQLYPSKEDNHYLTLHL